MGTVSITSLSGITVKCALPVYQYTSIKNTPDLSDVHLPSSSHLSPWTQPTPAGHCYGRQPETAHTAVPPRKPLAPPSTQNKQLARSHGSRAAMSEPLPSRSRSQPELTSGGGGRPLSEDQTSVVLKFHVKFPWQGSTSCIYSGFRGSMAQPPKDVLWIGVHLNHQTWGNLCHRSSETTVSARRVKMSNSRS